jgi:lipid-binding SYLF domain-containing protein
MKTFKFLKPSILALFGVSLMLISAIDESKQETRVRESVVVFNDFAKMKESIPRQLLEDTHGIIIVPKLINAGLIVGGERGKGIAIVKDAGGKWSDPVFVTLTGGSFGLQAGVQSTDLVLVFRHSETLRKIGHGSFTLGGDISAAAGPVGRSSSANTDYKLQAEAYSYSRSRGLFAGLTVKGVSVSVDAKSNTAFYGADYSSRTLFSETKSPSGAVKDLKVTLGRVD